MKINIPDFSAARVLVVGDVMLDRYWHGPTSRISPEAPVPIVKVEQAEERPGGAANVALNIAVLGGHADLVGLIGQDEAGASLVDGLKRSGVDCHMQEVAGAPTLTKLRVMSRHQQLIRLDFEDPFTPADAEALKERMKTRLAGAGAVILSDYGKGSLMAIREMIEAAKAAGVPVLVDPKSRDFSIYRGATLITPNLNEFEAVVGHCRDEQEIVEKGLALIEAQELEALLVTRGEQGMSLLRRDEEPLHLPTRAREVFDVTGAGDTVISVFAVALAAGEPMPQAMALANIAAGIVVGKLGTATASVPELRRAVHDQQATGYGIVGEDDLLELMQIARAHGERIVMTNGCFDILHAGHVTYLNEARRLGDRLIVAVNDDASVQMLKGPTRPVNHLQERMEVLAALESVDWVVAFSEETPERLICKLQPDILVKGGDYRPEEIAGYDCVMQGGGEVRVLSFKEGCSTSGLIDAIRDRYGAE